MPTLTLAQFLQLEDTEPSSEYACGRAFQKPMPNRHHSGLQTYLAVLLFQFLERTKLGEPYTEFRCIFGPSGRQRAYVPDVCYVSRERQTTDLFLHTAPDLAVEILSTDQHWAQFLDKIQFYLLYGVRLVWIVDPATRTITVEAPGQEAQILGLEDTLDGGDVLPGFRVAVRELFARI